MTLNNSENTDLTKKGTLRKRKPKTSNIYFTKDTENAILEYLQTSDQKLKNKIYKDRIEYAFFKLTQNIIHTFKMYYLDGESIEDVQQEVICFLLEKLHKYSPDKGAAYSYFGTIAKRYLIIRNQKNYIKAQERGELEEADIDDNIYNSLVKETEYEKSDVPLFSKYIDYMTKNLYDIFEDELEHKISNSILELFNQCRDLEVFNKKALFIYIKEMTDAQTIDITKVIKKFKVIYQKMQDDHYNKGDISKKYF